MAVLQHFGRKFATQALSETHLRRRRFRGVVLVPGAVVSEVAHRIGLGAVCDMALLHFEARTRHGAGGVLEQEPSLVAARLRKPKPIRL
jgi:hypothetical protein